MRVMENVLDASPDTDLQDVCNHFKDQQDVNLDWDYLHDKLGLEKPPDLPGITVPLKLGSADITAPRRFLLIAQSEFGQATIVIYYGPLNSLSKYEEPPEGQPGWRLYFGLNVTKDWPIAEIPVAGALDGGVLGLGAVQFMVTTAGLTEKECKNLYQLVTGKPSTSELGSTDYTKPPVPALTGMSSRVLFRVVVNILGSGYVLMVDAFETEQSDDSPPSTATVLKEAGALKFLRISGGYEETGPAIKVGLDCEAGLGPFRMAFKDLALHFPIGGKGKVQFTFDGVGITGAAGAALTFGADLEVKSLSPLNMWGGATLEVAEQFSAAALCGIAIIDSKASFFGYGFLKWPNPVPQPFDIDGMALGLGINRDLIIPSVDKLDKFPFIQAAMSYASPGSGSYTNPFPADVANPNSLISALNALGDAAPPKDGSYWFNAGVAFSAANQIFKGFALISVVLGDNTRISAVGELQATLPPQTEFNSNAPKLLFIDSFLELIIDITGGVIGLDAYIKHNSYVVERDAHLTGGLGIRIWFSGKHAAQFVVSVGGYSPRLDLSAYSYYPSIPRLAMTMDLGDGVQIKGKTYFAVTQAMAMYGVAFQISGKWDAVEIWAIVALNELISWDPFHYDADVSVEIGASLRIKVWFVHITITIHVGASLHIWGPAFSAYAHLDLGVCTVSWHFGADAKKPPPIGWDEFKNHYLPAANPSESLDDQPHTVSRVEVSSNKTIVLQRQVVDDIAWVVDPESTVIVTSSVIPSKSWSATTPGDGASDGNAGNTSFGVAPCDYKAEQLDTSHHVTIEAPSAIKFNITVDSGAVSSAIWADGNQQQTDPAAVCDNVIRGLKFDPVHPKPDQTFAADADNLLSTHDVLHLTHLEASHDHAGNFDGVTISGSIASSRAMNNRRGLFAAFGKLLHNTEIPDITADKVDVSGFANHQDVDLFISPPRLRLLGEDRV